jgi:hypothetical protein
MNVHRVLVKMARLALTASTFLLALGLFFILPSFQSNFSLSLFLLVLPGSLAPFAMSTSILLVLRILVKTVQIASMPPTPSLVFVSLASPEPFVKPTSINALRALVKMARPVLMVSILLRVFVHLVIPALCVKLTLTNAPHPLVEIARLVLMV